MAEGGGHEENAIAELKEKVQNMDIDSKDVQSPLLPGVVRCGNSDYVFNKRDREGKDYLGRGSFGLVFKGKRVTDGTTVAIKQIYHNGNSPGSVREIQFLKQYQQSGLSHENIVTIYQIIEGQFDSDRQPINYIVMEHCKYGDLSRLFREHPTRVESVLVKHDLMCQFLNGVEFLHSHDMAHRDLKPNNILVTDYPDNPDQLIAKITDFGSCKVLDGGSSTMYSSREVGTPWFKAPEFFQDNIEYSRKADIFSAGLTCLAMLQSLDERGKLHPRIEGKLIDSSMNDHLTIGEIMRKYDTNPNLGSVNIVELDVPEYTILSNNIRKMIKASTEYDPDDRPTVEDMLKWMNEMLKKPQASGDLQIQQPVRPKQAVSAKGPKLEDQGFSQEPDLVRTEFSKEKTQGYIEQHLGCGQLTNFMEQAENSGITELLSIPIVVVLSCSLYKENKSLPKRTELIEKIIFETIDKSLKKSGIEFPSEQIEACLAMLGKLSWESLLKQTQQLLIKKADVERESQILLHFGLLFAEELQYSIDRSTAILTFQHRMLQQFTAAFYISQQVIKESPSFLNIAIPDWDCIYKQKEVIKFVCGLLRKSNNGKLMADYVCRCITEYVDQRLDSGERLDFCDRIKEDTEHNLILPVELVLKLQDEAGLSWVNKYFSIYSDSRKVLNEVLAKSELTFFRWSPYLIDTTTNLHTVPAEIKSKVILFSSSNRFLDSVIKALGESAQAVLFSHLKVEKPSDLQMFLFPTSPRHLQLVKCQINQGETCKELGRALRRMHHLTRLDLGDNSMGKHGAFIAQALKDTAPVSKIRHLDLSRNNFPVEVSAVLLSALTGHTHLQTLILEHNQLAGCVSKLMQSPPPLLKHLGLSWTLRYVRDKQEDEDARKDVISISSAIANGKLSHIEQIDLSDNYLSESDLESLLKSVQDMKFPENPDHVAKLVLKIFTDWNLASNEFINIWKSKLLPHINIQ